MIAIAAPAAQAQAATPKKTTFQSTSMGWAPAPAPAAYYQRVAFDFWGAFECTLGVAAFIAGNTYLVLKIKRLGGVAKFAKLLRKAKSAENRAKVVVKAIGYVAGTGAMVKACTP